MLDLRKNRMCAYRNVRAMMRINAIKGGLKQKKEKRNETTGEESYQ